MGQAASIPARPPVPAGKTRLCVAGFGTSHHTARASRVARAVGASAPERLETWFYFDSAGYRGKDGLLPKIKSELDKDDQERFASHNSSPFCWFEYPDGRRKGIGGRDKLCEWAQAEFPNDSHIQKLTTTLPSRLREAFSVDKSPGTAGL